MYTVLRCIPCHYMHVHCVEVSLCSPCHYVHCVDVSLCIHCVQVSLCIPCHYVHCVEVSVYPVTMYTETPEHSVHSDRVYSET